jgi:LPXTG-site transpeptidase (sortase) family protein
MLNNGTPHDGVDQDDTDQASGPRPRRHRPWAMAAGGIALGVGLIAATGAFSAPSESPNVVVAAPQLGQASSSEAVPRERSPREPVTRQGSRESTREQDPAANLDQARGSSESTDGDDVVDSAAAPTTVLPGIPPAEVSIPWMGVQAAVEPVGLDPGGGVFVPEDVRTLGWFSASVPITADRGSSVIVGHRDSAVQGVGALSGIENLRSGDTIEVATETGDAEVFSVREVRVVAKTEFASVAEEYFAINGEHRLTLVTCGGAFDAGAGSYESNVFVTAVSDTA